MFLIHCLRVINKKTKSTLPAAKAAPLHRRGIVEYIPPLRGDSGGCAFLFFVSSLFTYSFISRIETEG